MESFLSRMNEKKKWLIVILFGVVIVLSGIVVWQMIQNNTREETPAMDVYEQLLAEESEVKVDEIKEDSEKSEETSPKEMVVDVKGAVLTPGVYTMSENTRVMDAIAKAGGLVGDADGNAVNLAQLLEDQMVIYVPKEGEEGEGIALGITHPQSSEQTEAGEEKVNINQAEKEALMTLKGIGSAKAENILSYREENGSFQTIEEIKNVSGIGDATFENLKEVITVD